MKVKVVKWCNDLYIVYHKHSSGENIDWIDIVFKRDNPLKVSTFTGISLINSR